MIMGINASTSNQVQTRTSTSQTAHAAAARSSRAANGASHASVLKDRTPAAADLWDRSVTPVRHDLIDAVRSQISRGGYDTLDRLDAAADQLLASL